MYLGKVDAGWRILVLELYYHDAPFKCFYAGLR